MRAATSVVRPLADRGVQRVAQLVLGLHHDTVRPEAFGERRPIQVLPRPTPKRAMPLISCLTRISPISSSSNATTMIGRFSRTDGLQLRNRHQESTVADERNRRSLRPRQAGRQRTGNRVAHRAQAVGGEELPRTVGHATSAPPGACSRRHRRSRRCRAEGRRAPRPPRDAGTGRWSERSSARATSLRNRAAAAAPQPDPTGASSARRPRSSRSSPTTSADERNERVQRRNASERQHRDRDTARASAAARPRPVRPRR